MNVQSDQIQGKYLTGIKHRDGKKLCTTCRIWIEESEFYPSKITWDKLRPSCKACTRQHNNNGNHRRGIKSWLDRYPLAHNTEGQLQCSRCKKWKVVTDFNLRSGGTKPRGGRAGTCKKCCHEQRVIRLHNPIHLERRHANWRKRYYTDPQFRLYSTIGKRIRNVLTKGYKSAHTLELLGCSIEELKAHLERQFQPGMTWENYGYRGWHVDHICECSRFDLTDPEQQRICFNYNNLQPMWGLENQRKSGPRRAHTYTAYKL